MGDEDDGDEDEDGELDEYALHIPLLVYT